MDTMADGVAAVARGLEHVNLAWALRWLGPATLPGIDRLVQMVVDGCRRSRPRELPTTVDGDRHGGHQAEADRRRSRNAIT